MESETHQINLISAQGLKPPTANLQRMQTYTVAWVDSTPVSTMLAAKTPLGIGNSFPRN
uniref:Uncharacterized protein n=1 Tax=Nelumbo nucifera TaxID=4432 RepID=A0A822Y1B3_NELNU|nr:TPA_asm: hypothetical protein HUJ06_026500 [Nelumbo nucifera]